MLLCWFYRTNFCAILVFSFSLEFFMGIFGQHTHAQSIQLGSTTALVEVKFNSLTLAALSFNIAKDLLVFSISPLSRSKEIEFSLNIAYRNIVGCNPNRIGACDKIVKYGRFCHNNSKFYFLLYVDQRNFATAVLV